jgi:hypothetical protein
MRLFKMVPVIALATAVAVTACEQEGTVEEGTELTPADTAMTTPPPATDMGMEADTMAMDEGDTLIIMEGDTTDGM